MDNMFSNMLKPGLSLDILKMESWTHMGRTAKSKKSKSKKTLFQVGTVKQ